MPDGAVPAVALVSGFATGTASAGAPQILACRTENRGWRDSARAVISPTPSDSLRCTTSSPLVERLHAVRTIALVLGPVAIAFAGIVLTAQAIEQATWLKI